jgi:hypothetical protein
LVAKSTEGIDQVVVIPVLAESAYLFRTLDSLAANPAEALARTLVICVVNNRAAPHVDHAHVADNAATLNRLHDLIEITASLRIGYVDASSPGHELPPKEGVGLARKIGLDTGLATIAPDAAPGLLLCLDADSPVETTYLNEIHNHFTACGDGSAVVAYAHPLDGPESEAIIRYELFLRYHTLGLRYAQSPYAFHTIGSTIACTADSYAAVTGMPRRQAAEDFYFLQKLAKAGPVGHIMSTTVYPAARPSWRVPFGTGASIAQHSPADPLCEEVYHPQCYAFLRAWIELVTAMPDADAQDLLDRSRAIELELGYFLEAQGFGDAWPRIQDHAPRTAQRLQQFHGWFDGFKTLKLIHHLRDTAYPSQPLVNAIHTLFDVVGEHCFDAPTDHQALLLHLRRVARRPLTSTS